MLKNFLAILSLLFLFHTGFFAESLNAFPETNVTDWTNAVPANAPPAQSIKSNIPDAKTHYSTCLDISGGLFMPLGELYGNMNLGADIGVHLKTPLRRLVSKEILGGAYAVLKNFDVGLRFGYIAGSSALNSSNFIVFAPLLLDIYYNLPFDFNHFRFYVFNGIGISLAAASVERSAGTLTRQSFDFTLRPGIGMDFYPVERFYLRLNLAYTAAFESIVGMGLSLTLGAGYVY